MVLVIFMTTWCITLSDNIGKVVNQRLSHKLNFTSFFIIFMEVFRASLAKTFKLILTIMSWAWYEAVHIGFQLTVLEGTILAALSSLLSCCHFVFKDSFSKWALGFASAYSTMNITQQDRNKDKNLKKRKWCRDAAHWANKAQKQAACRDAAYWFTETNCM